MKEPNDYSEFNDALVMMVDDEPLVMDVLEACLEENGYQSFVKVEDSRQAVEQIQRHNPDVVLLDLKMPHLDGFEILKQLRSQAETQFLSVIVLTSSDNSETKKRALELGATDFLAKPIDQCELLLRLKNTLTVKAYQDQLAYYDALTRLPNRKLFMDRLDWAVSHADRDNKLVSVLNVAVDRFQQVNDLLGPQAGDQLLVEVGQRLLSCLRGSDSVARSNKSLRWRNIARLSGDEFSVLLPKVEETNHVSLVAERIRESLKAPFVLEGREIFITVSIGIALYPEDAKASDSLMIRASAATSYAKKHGRDCFQFYCSDVNAITQRRMALEQGLRKAVENEELQVVYQPKVEVLTNRVIGMEALVRWHSPVHGSVSPEEFIPIAEETGIIDKIGEWVLFQAVTQANKWRRNGMDLSLSVNVSAYQFRDDHFPNTVQQILKKTGFEPEKLVIEITEGVLIGDRDRIGELLFKLKMTGTLVSVDDFGTGYSSLSYLKSFPIDELKIDRSFIVDVPSDADSSSIVKAIVAMADSLDLKIVAEGVETIDQLNYLATLGCNVIQGFYFSKPLPANAFWNFCQEYAKHSKAC